MRCDAGTAGPPHSLFPGPQHLGRRDAPVNQALSVLAADQAGYYLDEQGELLDTLTVLSRWQQHLHAWAQRIHHSQLLILEAQVTGENE
jgi:hypothetical protein